MREFDQVNRYSGVLARLARDKTGSTLAIMAAAMVPTIIIAGSAIDVTRMYVTKTRLQQACDAGALAGRKFMADSAASTLDSNAQTQAKRFFANNIKVGWMGTTAVSFSPTKTADNQVAGTASATLPMTIMASFGNSAKVIGVQCEARLDIPDSDIMFVLDTTGSMSCTPSDAATCSGAVATYTRSDGLTDYKTVEASGSKISALRDAVMLFYDTMVANSDPSTHVRYGFAPYTSMVNAGKLLPASSMVTDNWDYQSRIFNGDANYGNASSNSTTNTSNSSCSSMNSRNPASGYNATAENPGTNINFDSPTNGSATGPRSDIPYWSATKKTATWTSANNGTCTVVTQTVVPSYTYSKVSVPVAAYVGGSTVSNPTTWQSSPTKWRGCIEERDTVSDATFDSSNLPPDLNPDLPASSRATRWRPFWPEVAYYHSKRPTNASWTTTDEGQGWGTPYYAARGYSTCGKEAQRLQTMTRDQVSNYVNTDFVAIGGTYHDTGMIWGTRLISPTGPFASDTAPWPGRSAPNRHIIFMTDGNMAPNTQLYGMYGQEILDKRVTDDGSSGQLARHTARFRAVCDAARSHNITVWVIVFGKGGTMTADTKACAKDESKAYYVPDAASLKDTFKQIATQIAELRLSK